MTAVLQVGRCEFGRNPERIEQDGDRLALSGIYIAASLAAAKVIRQQALGLNEEDVVPLQWAGDSDLTGYYKVLRATVTPVLGVSYESFAFRWSLDLERVGGGYASPIVEVVASHGTRPTSPNDVTAARMFFLPPGYLHQSIGATGASGRVSSDGDVPTPGSNSQGAYGVAPANFYKAAATIETQVGGTWYPLIGRQLPKLAAADDIRLTNGLVRFHLADDGVITFEVWDTSAYESVGTFTAAAGIVTGSLRVAAAPTITTNTAHTVAIRVPVTGSDIGERNVYLDISLQRGQAFVAITFNATSSTVTLGASATTASTDVTGYLRQTSNGASGNRWLIGSDLAMTKDTTEGKVTVTSAISADMFLGVEINGSSATTANTAVDIAAQWWAGMSVTERVVNP